MVVIYHQIMTPISFWYSWEIDSQISYSIDVAKAQRKHIQCSFDRIETINF